MCSGGYAVDQPFWNNQGECLVILPQLPTPPKMALNVRLNYILEKSQEVELEGRYY